MSAPPTNEGGKKRFHAAGICDCCDAPPEEDELEVSAYVCSDPEGDWISELGGAIGADGNVYSDADSGL